MPHRHESLLVSGFAVTLALMFAVACDSTTPVDAGHDAGPMDGGPADGGPSDSGSDAGPADGGAPPFVESSSPVDGAVRVSVISELRAVFSEEMDEASVLAAEVRLYFGTTLAFGTFRYEAGTHALVFVPETPLGYGRQYHWSIQGAEDTDGNVMSPFAMTFDTYVNPAERRINYRAGAVVAYTDYTHTPEGGVLRETVYRGAGTDGTWFTSDDEVSQYYDQMWTGGLLTRRAGILRPGVDGVWFTADDMPNTVVRYLHDADGQLISTRVYGDAGPDGVFDTADDVITRLLTYTYTPEGLEARSTTYDGPGPDGMWETTDDAVQEYRERTYDGRETMVNGSFIGPGTDANWFTADDEARSYRTYSYEPRGLRTRIVQHSGPGPDGSWGTGDDVRSGYEAHTYDAEGHRSRYASYSGPGANATWFDADDEVVAYDAYTWTAGLLTRLTSYEDPGSDGAWFTGDDPASSYSTFRHDADRLVTEQLRLDDPGVDGIWFNADDTGRAVRTTYTAEGNHTEVQFHPDWGPDGMWFTGDDPLSQRVVYLTDR